MRRPEALYVKWEASLHRYARVPLRSWRWMLGACNYPHQQLFWIDLVICKQGYWLSLSFALLPKEMHCFLLMPFFFMPTVVMLGFSKAVIQNKERSQKAVQLEISRDSADIRSVGRMKLHQPRPWGDWVVKESTGVQLGSERVRWEEGDKHLYRQKHSEEAWHFLTKQVILNSNWKIKQRIRAKGVLQVILSSLGKTMKNELNAPLEFTLS